MTPVGAAVAVQRARIAPGRARTSGIAGAIRIRTVHLVITVVVHSVAAVLLRRRAAIIRTGTLVLTRAGVAEVITTRIGPTVDLTVDAVFAAFAGAVAAA